MVQRAGTARVGTFVGKVSGSDAYVAVVAAGKEVLAFVCDGDRLVKRRGTMAEWFAGPRSGNRLELVSENGARLEASLGARRAAGKVTPAKGATLTFEARPATGDAGLYRAQGLIEGRDVLAGWIVLGDGTFHGSSNLQSADCLNLRHALNRIFSKVTAGEFTPEDLEAGASIHQHLVNMGC